MAADAPQPSPAHDGVLAAAKRFLAASSTLLAARLDLASLEGRQAAGRVARIAAAAGIAAVAATFAYLLLLGLAVFLRACCAWPLHWILLGGAAFHVLAAAIAAIAVRSLLSKPFFRDTLAQFRKDAETLGQSNPRRP